MKTDDLIAMLASGPDVRIAARPLRATALPLAGAVLVSVLLMLLLLGPRADLAQEMAMPAFWMKVGFAAGMAGVSGLAARRLSTPGARMAALPWWLAAPVLVLWCVAGASLLAAAPDERAGLFWGATWRYCPLLIAVLSLPLLAVALRVMRSLAPTRLRLAGAAAGLASGSVAALVYCLHCPELSAVFVGFWYLLGMLIPTALGALLGPRVLGW